jgi:hypothetical protein
MLEDAPYPSAQVSTLGKNTFREKHLMETYLPVEAQPPCFVYDDGRPPARPTYTSEPEPEVVTFH